MDAEVRFGRMRMDSHLSISQVADLTHVSESTLRMWERRHGFPKAARIAGGHRRYSQRDVDNIRAVLALRLQGLHLRQAIDRVMREQEGRRVSVSGHLRAEGAAHETLTALWPLRIALTAIVDEVTLRGEDAVVVAGVGAEFPGDMLRRRAEALSASARLVVLLSEQNGIADGLDNVVHVPGPPLQTIGCEQLLIIDRSTCGLAVAVRPESGLHDDAASHWGMQWTIDPPLVRSTARLALEAVEPHHPGLVRPVLDLLGAEAPMQGRPPDGVVSAGVRIIRYLGLSEQVGPDPRILNRRA